MNLEELIYQRFLTNKKLVQQLATYADKPAIFSSTPPEDNQQGWQGKIQYPRMVYQFDLQANEERKSAGTLLISLYCQNTDKVDPEEIEPIIRNTLKDVLLTPENGTPYAFSWARTDGFEATETIQGHIDRLLIGSEIRFDILEYPFQETSDPDPILGMSQYLKALYPDSIVLGIDKIKAITEASKETPILYCRLISVEVAEETNNVVWMDGRIAIHILCPNHEVRLKQTVAIINKLSLDGEIILLDRSPMFLKHVRMDNQSDYLKDGQIFITGRYGLLRYQAKPHKLIQTKNQYR